PEETEKERPGALPEGPIALDSGAARPEDRRRPRWTDRRGGSGNRPETTAARRVAPAGRALEAAGIEPASRDAPAQASTCVGRRLDLVRCGSDDQDPQGPARRGLVAGRPSSHRRPACCVSAPPPAGEGTATWLRYQAARA